MILNLVPNFKTLAGKEVEFQSLLFAGGEPHIKINQLQDFSSGVSVTTRLNSFNDVGLLCVAVDALKRMDISLKTLFIPYFPAARQDRVMIPGEPLSVKVYADIINQLGFQKVQIYDAHSEVTSALVNNAEIIPNHVFIQHVLKSIKSDCLLISPDGGALKKIYKVSEFLGGIEVVECSKSRDVKTGKLSGFKVYSDDLQGKDCLIVDDICDGGGTFIGLAQELKKKNAGKLFLAVSHGIFNKGFGAFSEFERIFTTDSFRICEDEKLTTILLNELE